MRVLWFTAPLNPIQLKARATMESEQRVDVHCVWGGFVVCGKVCFAGASEDGECLFLCGVAAGSLK